MTNKNLSISLWYLTTCRPAGLRDIGRNSRGSVPVTVKRLTGSPNCPEQPPCAPSLYSMGMLFFLWAQSCRGVRLATHPHVRLNLRLCGAIHPLHQYLQPSCQVHMRRDVTTRMHVHFSRCDQELRKRSVCSSVERKEVFGDCIKEFL
jgi:hypothetical protein